MSDTPDDATADDTPADDTMADDPPATAPGASPQDSGDGAESAGSGRRSVAASAGIDEAVLGVPRELASTVRLEWIVGSTIAAAVVGAIITGMAFAVGAGTSYLATGLRAAARLGGAAFALLVLIGVVRAVLLFRSWSYVVRADSLYLSRGVLTRVRTVVPYVRVQHIDTTRGPLERLLGLSTLVVYTAGSRGADVTIPGLTPDRASTLQGRLERLAIESEEADAV